MDVGPRASPAEAQQLLSLLAAVDQSLSASSSTGGGEGDAGELLTGLHPLCAFVMAVTPPWSTEQQPAEDAGFKALAQSKEVAAAVAGLKDAPSGFAAVARLAFGVAMAALQGSADGFEDGKGALGLVAAAIDAGALRRLVPHESLRNGVACLSSVDAWKLRATAAAVTWGKGSGDLVTNRFICRGFFQLCCMPLWDVSHHVCV